jgi:GR25 family glycosyltransferase involved in LPS biosynthesis
MYRGFFINLDRNTRRLTAMTEHLKERGILDKYQRFPAVEGRAVAAEHPTSLDAGALGIWLTHENLLRANIGSDAHLHIMEDDAVLARGAADMLPSLMGYADSQLADWDVVFTDTLFPLDHRLFSEVLRRWLHFKSTGRISLFSLRGLVIANATSLFINKKSINKYLDLISGKWSQGIPIDLHIRALINDGKLNAYTCVPFLSSLSEESKQSDIRGQLDASRIAYSAYSRAVFIDADHAEINKELVEIAKDVSLPSLAEVYIRSLAFTLTDKFQKF